MADAYFEQLVDCFEEVFPKLSRSAIPASTHDNVAEWDSIAQLTLLSLIGESFHIDIDFEEFEGATSFTAILELLMARAGNV